MISPFVISAACIGFVALIIGALIFWCDFCAVRNAGTLFFMSPLLLITWLILGLSINVDQSRQHADVRRCYAHSCVIVDDGHGRRVLECDEAKPEACP